MYIYICWVFVYQAASGRGRERSAAFTLSAMFASRFTLGSMQSIYRVVHRIDVLDSLARPNTNTLAWPRARHFYVPPHAAVATAPSQQLRVGLDGADGASHSSNELEQTAQVVRVWA